MSDRKPSEKFLPHQRAEEKAASRAADAEAFRSGQKSVAQLRRENNAFHGMSIRLDIEHAKKVR